MEVIKLGKKGQVSIPKSILSQLGLPSETLLLVETTQEGGILLQPAGVYPIEVYSQERLEAFAEADQLTVEEAQAITAKLGKSANNATLS
jgi:AbrB family looped-hinge helix DNA binding protein